MDRKRSRGEEFSLRFFLPDQRSEEKTFKREEKTFERKEKTFEREEKTFERKQKTFEREEKNSYRNSIPGGSQEGLTR